MKRLIFAFGAISMFFILSCTRTDFSNPEDVLKNHRRLRNEYQFEKIYDKYLSLKSKELIMKDEFVKYYNPEDSIRKTEKVVDTKITALSPNPDYPTYRRFKLEETKVVKNDTVRSRIYYTLINEDGKWKVIWTNTLSDLAYEKYIKGDYEKVIELFRKLIEIDPFSGIAYSILSWCTSDRTDALQYAKQALALEEENSDCYNTLASCYSRMGDEDLAILNYERGVKFCLNESEKTTFYSNIASSFCDKKEYAKAEEYIEKSIKIDEKNTHAWMIYGIILSNQGNHSKAVECYERALSLPKMPNGLQGFLYYYSAESYLKTGECDKADKYILEALNISPDNARYKMLFNKIKSCK